jgi:hypothetical protein
MSDVFIVRRIDGRLVGAAETEAEARELGKEYTTFGLVIDRYVEGSRLDQVTRERDEIALASKVVYALADVTAERDALLLRLDKIRVLAEKWGESSVGFGDHYVEQILALFVERHAPIDPPGDYCVTDKPE